MANPPAEDPARFLSRQTKDTLVALLLELAQDHEVVQGRIARMQLADQPSQLAASFMRTLNAWKSSNTYYDHDEADVFADQLENWVNQVERELAPSHPAAALELFRTFIESDASWFELADDSYGAIGTVIGYACEKWLETAARCERPAAGWSDLILQLYFGDGYGPHTELLRSAHLLRDEATQRDLVAQLETRLIAAMETSTTRKKPRHSVYEITAALSLLAESLGDPDLAVRATLQWNPNPKPEQRQSFARSYLEAKRPGDALIWLQDSWETLEHNRIELLAMALEQLGRFEESVPLRRKIFEQRLSDHDLDLWLEHLPVSARPEALEHARTLALEHTNLEAAVSVLLRVNDPASAEARLLAESDRIHGGFDFILEPIAAALRQQGCLRGETVIYRAMLKAVLDRGHSRTYEHAAGYWSRLLEIANGSTDLAPLAQHDVFEAEIRGRHGRKTAFWSQVKGSQAARRGT